MNIACWKKGESETMPVTWKGKKKINPSKEKAPLSIICHPISRGGGRRTMLYPVICKPYFNLVMTRETWVNFCTCKWHLIVPNLSLCWVFDVSYMLSYYNGLRRRWWIPIPNLKLLWGTANECDHKQELIINNGLDINYFCWRFLTGSKHVYQAQVYSSTIVASREKEIQKTCCICISKYAKTTLNVDPPQTHIHTHTLSWAWALGLAL